MYSSQLGRFLSQDPLTRDPAILNDNNWFGARLSAMQNAYRYADNNPVNWTDPSGLVPSIISQQLVLAWIAQFNAWYQAEMQNMGWLSALPDCPCALPKCGDDWKSPDPDVWGLSDPLGYHPGAVMCLRSETPTASGAGQQCCYDSNGGLITNGPGAGTPDKVAPGFPYYGHYSADVGPYDLAAKIDKFGTQYNLGGYVSKYLQVRPPNNGKGCAKNP